MAFLHSQSCKCLKTELSLFDIRPTQTTIEGSRLITYTPISFLTYDTPIEFVIPSNFKHYIDFAYTLLSLRVSIKCTLNSDKIPEGMKDKVENVGPVNNFMHSLFSHVDVLFNQKPVTPPSNSYAYRYFNNLY